ncbi:unnamed protein product [Linum trigynum]|uniref:Phosphoglycerate kinase n=1 Tax=Linum trigynum TaxID=586398 RepID=A0AAV2GGU0_9ROSI
MAAKKYVGSLKEADLKGKRVFVDVDLNVPLDDNHKITDDTRVYSAVPTIKYSTPLLSRDLHQGQVIFSVQEDAPRRWARENRGV